VKALFFKEVRQGKIILLFGPCFGLALLLLASGLMALFPQFTWQEITQGLSLVGIGGTLLIALFSGASVFSGEVDRGTLPLLLSLPLSRSRIWGAKILAGLALGLSASSLLLLASAPLYYLQFNLPYHRPDLYFVFLALLCWWFAAFCCSMLFSLLLEHTISAILATVLFFGGLGLLVFYTVFKWGGALRGNDLVVDGGLWLATLLPAMLLASLAAFRRGELLRGGKKWRTALPVFLLVAGVTILSVIGGVRWSVRYLRAQVQAVYSTAMDWNGSTLSLQALRSPLYNEPLFWNEEMGQNHYWRNYEISQYRSQDLVVLDLATGKERFVLANGRAAALSSDGGKALVMAAPFTLTWLNYSDSYATQYDPIKFSIVDLATGRSIFQGSTRDLFYNQNAIFLNWISWSPGDSWLAFPILKREAASRYGLIVARPGGGAVKEISLSEFYDFWAWAPADKGAYYFDSNNRLMYAPLPFGEDRVLWEGNAALHLAGADRVSTVRMAASPDGRWLALQVFVLKTEGEKGYTSSQKYEQKLRALLISSDGRRVYPLQQIDQQGRKIPMASDFVWSPDSRRLYYVSGWTTPTTSEKELQLCRVGENAPAVSSSKLPAGSEVSKIIPWPATGELLLWGKSGVVLADEQGQIKPFPNNKVSALAKGDYRLLGLDKAGRAIVLRDSDHLPRNGKQHLDAVDLTTGTLKQIYP
jgi:ABC-type transport system involved in multi-copper enzyme maturation permease subunit